MNMMDWIDEWRLLTIGRSEGKRIQGRNRTKLEMESESGMGYGCCAHLFV